MALTLKSETAWHGNPRPTKSYANHIVNDAVQDANGYFHNYIVNSSTPLSSLAPSASIVTPGPDLVVVGDLNGLWPQFTILDVAITVTGGTDIVDSFVQAAAATLTPEDAAVRLANAFNDAYGTEIICAHTGGGNITISALAGVTGLTITTWAVA